jgi:hypothetical protein
VSAGRPPIAVGGWDVLRKETGMLDGTEVEEVRTTRFLGWGTSRIFKAISETVGRGG